MSRTAKGPPAARRDVLEARLMLCMGAGGVGKTSTAAAIACAGAMRGRRCGLITVDPARRLRNALGLDHLPAAPTRIELDAPGDLFAMALDTKRAFDDLIERVAPSAAIAAAILSNPLYRELSNELGGSTEYMAMEKLHQLLMTGDYDLLVVDTPPSAHARDLLEAPARIATLVDSGAARVLRAPSSILRGNRFADAALAAILAVLERWIGRGLVRNLSDFASAFEPLLAGFRERAGHVQDTLRDERTAIVIVTTAERAALAATRDLFADLAGNDVPVAGIIANRIHTLPPAVRTRLHCAAPLREKLRANHAEYATRADRDRTALIDMATELAPILATIPRLEEPISSLDHLSAMAKIVAAQLPGGGRVR
jgi:anion-transporting  ArsA/GET3 family ATPase